MNAHKNTTTNATGRYNITRKEMAVGTYKYQPRYAGTATYALSSATQTGCGSQSERQ